MLNNALATALLIAFDNENNTDWQSLKGGVLQNIHAVSRDRAKDFECYDRWKKTRRNGLAKTRLEFRSVGSIHSLEQAEQHGKEWISLLGEMSDNGFSCYDDVQKAHTGRLFNLWKQDLSSGKVRNKIGFLAYRREYILTSKQLVDLCGSRDVAYTYKRRLGLSFIQAGEFIKYLSLIAGALETFFET